MPNIFMKKSAMFCNIFLIFLSSIIIQNHLLLNWDVCFHLNITEQAINNGSYFNNSFDIVPLIFYLYLLPVFISKLFSLSVPQGLYAYLFLLASISLMSCAVLLRMIFFDNKFFAQIFLVFLAITWLILPAFEFGQREHIMMVLVFPYFCLASLRANNKTVSFNFAFFVGLLAGIGFAIKPFFYIPFLLIETYLLLTSSRDLSAGPSNYSHFLGPAHKAQDNEQKLGLLSWARIETVTILTIGLIYIVLTLVFYPNFIHIVLPEKSLLFYGQSGYHDFSLANMVLRPNFLFCCLVLLVFALAPKPQKHKEFGRVMLLGLIGFMSCYIFQHAPFYYRILPALAQACLILLFLIFLHLESFFIPKLKNILILSGIILFIFNFPLLNTYAIICDQSLTKKNLLHGKMVQLINRYPAGVSAYFIASNNYMTHSLIYYTPLKEVSQFYNLWWISPLLKQSKQRNIENEKNFFLGSVVSEIENVKPRLIFVDTTLGFDFDKRGFDYIEYLSQKAEFKKAWKAYQFLAQVDNFKVYERTPYSQ